VTSGCAMQASSFQLACLSDSSISFRTFQIV
jgi:hypothetical protein